MIDKFMISIKLSLTGSLSWRWTVKTPTVVGFEKVVFAVLSTLLTVKIQLMHQVEEVALGRVRRKQWKLKR